MYQHDDRTIIRASCSWVGDQTNQFYRSAAGLRWNHVKNACCMALPDDKCGGLPRLCLSAEPRNGHTRPAATSNKVKDFYRKRR